MLDLIKTSNDDYDPLGNVDTEEFDQIIHSATKHLDVGNVVHHECFMTPVPSQMSKRLSRPTFQLLSPFVCSFESSVSGSGPRKDSERGVPQVVLAGSCPLDDNIGEPPQFNSHCAFLEWLEIGKKNRNKYVIQFFVVFFTYINLLLVYYFVNSVFNVSLFFFLVG